LDKAVKATSGILGVSISYNNSNITIVP